MLLSRPHYRRFPGLCCLWILLTSALPASTFLGVPRDEIETTLQLAYQLDDGTPSAIQKLIANHPESPVGYLIEQFWCLAAVTYWRGGNKELDTAFHASYERAKKVSQTYRRTRRQDPEAELALGLAEAAAARFYIKRKRWWSAAFKARAGFSRLKKVPPDHPSYADSLMMVGVANCYLADAPAYLKPLVFLMRFSGDRNEGLDQLKTAATAGFITRYEAQYYKGIVHWELTRDYDAAVAALQPLAAQFPQNVEFHRLLIDLAFKQHNDALALELIEEIFLMPRRKMLGPQLDSLGLKIGREKVTPSPREHSN